MLQVHPAPRLPGYINRIFDALGHESRVIIAGGAARKLMVGDEAPDPSDVDVFLLEGVLPDTMIGRMFASGFKLQHQRPGSATFITPRSTLPVQLVLSEDIEQVWSDPQGLIDSFGFTTEQFAVYYDSAQRLTFMHYDIAVETTLNRELVVNNILDPVRLLWRINKYGRKGYTISLDEVQHIADYYAGLPTGQQQAIREGTANLGPASDPEAHGDFAV